MKLLGQLQYQNMLTLHSEASILLQTILRYTAFFMGVSLGIIASAVIFPFYVFVNSTGKVVVGLRRMTGCIITTVLYALCMLYDVLQVFAHLMALIPYMCMKELMRTTLLDDLEIGIRNCMYAVVDIIGIIALIVSYVLVFDIFIVLVISIMVIAVLIIPIRVISPDLGIWCANTVSDGIDGVSEIVYTIPDIVEECRWQDVKVPLLACMVFSAGLLQGLPPYAPVAGAGRIQFSTEQLGQQHADYVEHRRETLGRRDKRMKFERASINQPR
jgi:hypothetical protein